MTAAVKKISEEKTGLAALLAEHGMTQAEY
jgi:hypothetical protein